VSVALSVGLAVATLGCGPSDPGPSATPSPGGSSVVTGAPKPATAGTTYPEGQCISRMPGQILTADEAVVRFSPSQVCPGYVTIVPGTPVTFKNQDTKAHTITITEGNMPDGKAVTNGIAEPGQTWVRTFDTVGTYTYVTDAIPTFRGTVEVTTPGATSH
jgi:plastocyanin